MQVNQKPLFFLITAIFSLCGTWVVSCAIYYFVGAGVLDYRKWFFVLPSLFIIMPLCAILLARIVYRRNARRRDVVLIWLGVSLLTFLFRPSWKEGDKILCYGLKYRILSRSSVEALTRYLHQVVLIHSHEAASEDSFYEITNAPDWLRKTFSEPNTSISLSNSNNAYGLTYLRIWNAGPLLQYGCDVGLTASDVAPLGRYSTESLSSNVIVFAE